MKLFRVNVADSYLSKISGACNAVICVLLLWEAKFCILLVLAGVSKSVNHSPEQTLKGKFAKGLRVRSENRIFLMKIFVQNHLLILPLTFRYAGTWPAKFICP